MGYLVIVLVYLAVLIVGGAVMSRKRVKNADDFVVAGRRLPFIILVGTLLATWCGGGGVTGSANVIYSFGPYAGIVHFLGPPLGIICLYFVAGKIRQSAKYTIPEIFEARYGVGARILSAACVILAYVGIVATQFKAAGSIISLTTGMDLNTATALAAVGIVLLTVTGGMITVAYSDAFSALLMVGGFLIAVPLLFGQIGGIGHAFATLPQGKDTLTGSLNWIQLLGYMLPSFFLILGDQNMMQRFSSAKNSKEAKKSNIGMFVAEVTVITLILLIVVAGIFLIPQTDRPDTVIFQLAMQYLPFGVGAVVLAACVAFVVTTADSYLLSSATNLTYDIWGKFLKKDATDKQRLLFIRMVIVVFAAVAYALCMYFPSILAVQMYSYSMYGAAITPALLCALFSKRVTKAAGVCGIVAGGVFTIVWDVALKTPLGIQSAILSVPFSFLVIVVVTMLTQNSGKIALENLYKDA